MALDGSRAQYYRTRAQEVREKARHCLRGDVREDLEMVARHFDEMAEAVEQGKLKP